MRRRWRQALAALALAVTVACTAPPAKPPTEPPTPPWDSRLSVDHALVGRVFVPAEKRFISPTEAVRRLAAADFVLLGEKHDNPDHHRLQAWLVQRLIAVGRRPAVVMEMIDTNQTAAIAAHLREHPGDAAGLGDALQWGKSGWPPWEMYQPIALAAVAAGLPLVPGNLPRTVARGLVHKDAAAMARAKELGLDLPLPPAVAEAMAEDIRAGHCGLLPETLIPGMVLTQRARDATLASAMAEPGSGAQGAVLIAGSGHTRSDWGVPARLRTLDAARSLLSLAFLEVSADETEAAAYGQVFGVDILPFDLVWFTPRLDDGDPCTGLAENFKKRR